MHIHPEYPTKATNPEAHTCPNNHPEPAMLITIDLATGLTRPSVDQAPPGPHT